VSADLVADLQSPLPASVQAGTATAVLCYGTCYHRREPVVADAILVDGARHRPAATGMPRPDLFDAEPRAFRSGFWGTVPVGPREQGGTVHVELAARLPDGSEAVVPLGLIEVVERRPAPSLGPSADVCLIAVCMATYEPDIALFRAQVESLRAQTDRRWVCVVSDDHSSPQRFAEIEDVLAGDDRFIVSRSDRRLGFYRNFERALRMAPDEARLVALCDQDDRWHPDKLEVLRAALGTAQLVYCDQRLVDADGRVLRETLWEGRRNNHTSLASMLVANTITGAATLFPRELAELALPFPNTPGMQFHDHWLGLVALAAGDIAYVDRPLYDYVQHAGAVFGDVTSGAPEGRRGALRGGRAAYFLGYLAREVQAQTLLVRCADRLTPAKRRTLERYVAAQRSPFAFAWLAARPLRALAGRNETLGAERELAHGIVWRWLVALLARGARKPGRRPLDATFPDVLDFEQRRLREWRARV
jgi:hypothetical protein